MDINPPNICLKLDIRVYLNSGLKYCEHLLRLDTTLHLHSAGRMCVSDTVNAHCAYVHLGTKAHSRLQSGACTDTQIFNIYQKLLDF